MEYPIELQEKIDYVKERAMAEGRVPEHVKQEYGDILDFDTFISNIIYFHDEFFYKADKDEVPYNSTDDEHNYVVEKTNYSQEMVELVLWFDECHQMKTDCVTYVGNCAKCGHDELFIREEEGELFCSLIECGKCGEKYSYEEMFELEEMDDFEESIFRRDSDDREDPFREGTVTDESYIIKAATGYRKGIWRKIQISTGATLDELSSAILDAFEFDEDHLYAFYMDEKGRKRNVPVYYSPDCRENPRADKVMLKDFHFMAGAKFLYLYDFGDEWHFTITVEKETAETTLHPFVVQSRGEAPEQYAF